MQTSALYISLSKHKVFCFEKVLNQNTIFIEKSFDVGYNQSSLQVFIDGIRNIKTSQEQTYCTLKYPFFVLIPEVIFEIKDAASYLEGIDLTGKRVMWDKISRNGVICIYAIEEVVYEQIVLKYPNGIIRHYATVMIDHSLKTAILKNSTVIAIDFESEEFYMCICKGNELLLCNKFEFKSPEDILYFMLYSLEQFQLTPNNCKVFISGLVETNMESVILLREYFEDVFTNEANTVASSDFKFQSVLLHLNECE